MTTLELSKVEKVLCVGAHSDDIEIGCGGTVLKLIQTNPNVEVRWMVFSGDARRQVEANRSAASYLEGAGRSVVMTRSFRDGFFPDQWAEIKQDVENLRREFDPDVILTHFRDDRHQDHRVLSDLAWNTYRNHLILEYEIPKYDGDLGAPNTFVPLDEELCRKKVELLMRHFRTQTNKHWFSEDLFMGLMRIRGMECASPSGYAEAFYCRKLVLS